MSVEDSFTHQDQPLPLERRPAEWWAVHSLKDAVTLLAGLVAIVIGVLAGDVYLSTADVVARPYDSVAVFIDRPTFVNHYRLTGREIPPRLELAINRTNFTSNADFNSASPPYSLSKEGIISYRHTNFHSTLCKENYGDTKAIFPEIGPDCRIASYVASFSGANLQTRNAPANFRWALVNANKEPPKKGERLLSKPQLKQAGSTALQAQYLRIRCTVENRGAKAATNVRISPPEGFVRDGTAGQFFLEPQASAAETFHSVPGSRLLSLTGPRSQCGRDYETVKRPSGFVVKVVLLVAAAVFLYSVATGFRLSRGASSTDPDTEADPAGESRR
jgi:hypothetical protein